MSIIAFLPARGGSKSIPEKNIKSFCGKPLIFWNLQELQNSNVDKVIVATDCKKIKDTVLSFDFSSSCFPRILLACGELVKESNGSGYLLVVNK